MIPIHPEAVPGSPDELRWVMPAGTLDFVGDVVTAPASVQALVDSGVIASMVVEPTAVRIRLGENHSWRSEGGTVRSALGAALTDPGAWAPIAETRPDDVLRAAVAEVVQGEVGDYIRSHGGRLDVVSVADGNVAVALGGTCAHCPASDVTLTDRFEDAVRERFPALVGVTAAADPGIAGGRRLLGLFPSRPR